jgi:formylglycine-generating enzyme required for sulfatase activity
LRLGGDGRYTLQLEVAARTYRVAEGQALEYPGRTERRRVRWQFLPVSGVTLAEAMAYAEAMAQSGRIPSARLCRELEWERAARGADGRRYPHGDQLAPDEANIDRTYGQVPAAFGPDEVGSHPTSESPFGISDLAGNAYEWTLGAAGPVIRGGSWYQGASTALAANRDPTEPTMRSSRLGFRLCADP